MITWIYGNSKAGKTTLAKKIVCDVWLDGDIMRQCWKLGFTKEDRIENNMRFAIIAKALSDRGLDVVVSTICPYREQREEIKKMTGCRFVYLEGGLEGENYPFEKPL